ncbi:MAG: ATP synthase subunit I [Nitrospirota bacterium]
MTDKANTVEHSASAVATGVAKKTAVLTGFGTAAAVAVQMTAWPGLSPWTVPAGVLIGGVLGVLNFRWLAYAVERVYLRQGASSLLANVAAAVVNVLKLSAIFIVLFVVIKNRWVHIVGLVLGLTCCFGAILWQGFGLMTDLKEDRGRTGSEQ